MRPAAEAGQAAADRRGRDPDGPRQRGRGQGVDPVVRPGDLQVGQVQQQLAGRVGAERAVDQGAGADPELPRGRLPQRHGHRARMAGDQRRGDRVAGVGDGHRGQAQDARLRVPVGREGAVPVGVVVGDVEDDGGGRRERGGPVQLEAGELDGDDVVGGRPVVLDGGDDLDQRAPDVPGGDGAAAVGQQDRLEHGDRRRLAVGAGDRQPRRGRAVGARHPQPPGELRLADDLDAAARGVHQQRCVRAPAR